MKHFLLIDDHEVVRSGVSRVLGELFPSCGVYEARDQRSAIQQLKERPYDLAIMDVHMPDSNATGLVGHIRRHYPEVPVLIFSVGTEKAYAKKFIQAGASGYLSKNASLTELKKAVDRILLGRKYINAAQMTQFVIGGQNSEFSSPFEKLSAREFEIALLLIAGESVSTISGMLKINRSTVGTHKAHILAKLGVGNLVELLDVARMHGIK